MAYFLFIFVISYFNVPDEDDQAEVDHDHDQEEETEDEEADHDQEEETEDEEADHDQEEETEDEEADHGDQEEETEDEEADHDHDQEQEEETEEAEDNDEEEEEAEGAEVEREDEVNKHKLKYDEWPEIKHLLRKCKRKFDEQRRDNSKESVSAFEMFTHEILTIYPKVYRNTAKLLAIASTIPMSSAECERAFSLQNRIKSKTRSRLTEKNVQALMVLAHAKVQMDEFDINKAITIWSSKVARKL